MCKESMKRAMIGLRDIRDMAGDHEGMDTDILVFQTSDNKTCVTIQAGRGKQQSFSVDAKGKVLRAKIKKDG